MASLSSHSDFSACSICFEKQFAFEKPRYLPCSHLFCHGCLSAHIVTSCESKEAPIGFACPLCREFIPSPVPNDKPGNWADKFPICEMLEKYNNLMESRLCSACERENEEEEATNICLTCRESLCVICTKCHRRNLASNTHKIIPINDPNAVRQLSTASVNNENCQEHPERKIEMYCNDHSKPCCTMCVSTEHRRCDSIDDIQKASDGIKNSDNLNSLQEELSKYEVEMQKAKKSHEDNITEIENTSDLITEEIKKLKKEIIDQLDKLESEHLNELSKVTKKSREILNRNIDSISDRIQFSSQCFKSLEEVKVETGASFMKEYQKIKGNFEWVKKHNWTKKELKIKIASSAARDFKQIKSAAFHSKPQATKSESYPVTMVTDLNLSKAHFSLLYDFDEPNLNVCGGTFLPDGTFIIANFKSDNIGLIKYSLTNNCSTPLKTFRSSRYLFDLLCVGNELYITDNTKRRVIVISNDTFTTLREFSVRKNLYPYGIAVWKKFLFVACQTAIVKYDMQGNLIHTYLVEERVRFVVVLDNGHIVYSNEDTNNVTAMDGQETFLWTYSSPKLRTPYSVDKDEMNHIYVAGTDSNNIHILSSSGSLIRIVEDIPSPAFMKVKDGSNICFVCSHWKKFIVYEIK